jgi:type IV secretory pathway TrbD component
MTRDEGRLIEGYEAPIHAALWQRILTMGVPRLWFILWLMGCIFATFALFSKDRNGVAVVPLILWGIGHVVLMAVTRWDRDWDSVLAWSLRYRSKYEAG